MSKVMCITEQYNLNNDVYPVFVGNYYTITSDVEGYEGEYVHILEHPTSKRGYKAAYNNKCFAPLSDIDELTLVNNKEKEYA